MGIHRVALIFDDRPRPDTTGVHVRRALADLGEVVHYRPDQRDEIPATGFDLYLSIDDDTDHRLPDSPRPRAYWAIDTHLDFPARFERSVPCDLVFAAQRGGAERLRQAGIHSAVWLPLACDPEIHRRHEVPKEHDISFVGNAVGDPRAELISPQNRRIVTMHWIEERTVPEIADELGLSQDGVKARLHRARAKLKDRMVRQKSGSREKTP